MKAAIKRIASAVLMTTVLLASAGTAYADEEMEAREAERAASYEVVPDTNNIEGWPQGPQVYGNSAIVMDMNSGAVLYAKKPDERHYPASITKLMTALVALENASLEDEVYFSEDSVSFLEYGDASIGMTPGEILSMNDALYGMLLASANEVSYAIAESVGKLTGGGFDTFIQKMNDRAEEIGCTGSHWVNANGLHDEQHYTTAHDMALIASKVYQFEEFRTVVQTLNYTIGTTNLVGETRTFQQNHKMLWPQNANYYEYCTGGKTGYTDQARTTLVTMADDGNLPLAAVVLRDYGNDAYIDTRAMFDYAFANFVKVPLNDQEKAAGISSYEDENAYIVLPSGADFSSVRAKITVTDKTKAAGTVTYTYQGQNVGSAAVKLTEEYVKEETGYSLTPEITGTGTSDKGQNSKGGLPLAAKIVIGIAAGIILLFVILYVYLRYKLAKRRKMRMERARRRRQEQRGVRQYSASHSRMGGSRNQARGLRGEHTGDYRGRPYRGGISRTDNKS